jgi:hypothetical protein
MPERGLSIQPPSGSGQKNFAYLKVNRGFLRLGLAVTGVIFYWLEKFIQ